MLPNMGLICPLVGNLTDNFRHSMINAGGRMEYFLRETTAQRLESMNMAEKRAKEVKFGVTIVLIAISVLSISQIVLAR
jgi:hypothetical protein